MRFIFDFILNFSGFSGLSVIMIPRVKVVLEFFQDELSSLPAVFSSCAHIPYTHFNTRLVSIGCYGYEI